MSPDDVDDQVHEHLKPDVVSEPKRLELNHSDITIDELTGVSSSSPYLSGFKGIERLRVMPGPLEVVPKVACKILEDHDTIRELDVNLFHVVLDESTPGSDGLHMLWKSLEPSRTRLHTLNLTDVSFGSGHKTLSALHFPSLASLTIATCSNAEEFLTALAKSALKSPTTLKRLTIHHSQAWVDSWDPEDTTTEPLVAAIDLLLANLTALEHIWICLRGYRTLPLVKGIANQGLTLKWLFIDIRAEKGVEDRWACSYAIELWQILCQSLKTIRQLDMVSPRAMNDYLEGPTPEFESFIKATAGMRTLTVLGINNWPRLLPEKKTGGTDNIFRTRQITLKLVLATYGAALHHFYES
ncbi:MAG: hypothetical protein Q9168_003202 [Polycauliona sp. 1 TL-2023]